MSDCTVESMMHCRAHIKFGLHIHNMGETDVDTLRLEKWS